MRTRVITVHGIRTYGKWQERLEGLTKDEVKQGDEVEFKHKHYGYFSAFKFLNPFARRAEARRFSVELAKLLDDNSSSEFDRVCLVGHSFGTHIIAHALKSLSKDLKKKVDTVIFAASVLSLRYAWDELFGSRVTRLVNDCGSRDKALPVNAMLPFGSGVAGRNGFDGVTDSEFKNRWFNVGHSGYFYKVRSLPEATDDNWFMRKYWVPLLTSDDAIDPHDERPDGLLPGIITSFVAATERLKWVPPILAMLLLIGIVLLGTTSRWIADGAPVPTVGPAGLVPNTNLIATVGSNATELWDADSGERTKIYDGRATASGSGFLILKYRTFSAEGAAYFKFLNLSTGEENKLEGLPFFYYAQRYRSWVDKDFFFLFFSTASDERGPSLFVADPRTGDLLQTFNFPERTGLGGLEVRAIDDDRILLVTNPTDAPEVRSISTRKEIATLRKPTDKLFRLWAFQSGPEAKQVVTIQKTSDESNEELSRFPGIWDAKVSVRIWDLTNAVPNIVAEHTVNVADVKDQYSDYEAGHPESGDNNFETVLRVYRKAIAVEFHLKNSSAKGTFLYDASLKLLDHGLISRHSGIIDSDVRPMMFFGKKDSSLVLWDVDTGQVKSLPEFDVRSTDRFEVSRNGKQLLTLRAGPPAIELSDIDQSKRLKAFSIPSANDAFLSLRTPEIATWHTGGVVNLWKGRDREPPTATLSGISNKLVPVVWWNPSRCEALVWSEDGRRLKFVGEWNVLGLLHFRMRNCA